MSDEPGREDLDRFVRGDADALEALFRRFNREVYRWALRITRDHGAAEEVVVETFWRAYRGRARFDASKSFGAWLRRIATNAALDELGRSKRRHVLQDVAPSAAEATTAPHEFRMERALRSAFEKLPRKLRVVATHVLIEERTHAEAADALDLPIGTVKSRAFRALRALRKDLEQQGMAP
jgi:RNA polymerase sigma-70 factor (ECF subfamily)